MVRIWRVRSLGINVKRTRYESIMVLNMLYGAETWNLNAREKNKIKYNGNEKFAKYM